MLFPLACLAFIYTALLHGCSEPEGPCNTKTLQRDVEQMLDLIEKGNVRTLTREYNYLYYISDASRKKEWMQQSHLQYWQKQYLPNVKEDLQEVLRLSPFRNYESSGVCVIMFNVAKDERLLEFRKPKSETHWRFVPSI